ncbi:hypothetical protein [Serratia inhibens]|uniref:hypothetical protein n=1 Tax=Serratia inhibens TaxID=2338073 RepID=UPI00080963F4|nr:hypothetical protein [Serratia inhibens]ANS43746.1 hypothetical protein Q5A_016500 [Serratia inhibens PRI-2C]
MENSVGNTTVPPGEVGPVKFSHWKPMLYAAFFSSAVTILVWLFVMLCLLKPAVMAKFGFVSKYFLTNPKLITEDNQSELVTLISNGTVLSLNDLWTFQTGLYQTIIALLIGVNAILATLSFFMIRNSTSSVAREEAIKEVKVHVNSHIFNKKVKRAIHKKFSASELDFLFLTTQMEELLANSEELKNAKVESESMANKLKDEINSLKAQLEIIISNISSNDREEYTSGSNLSIKERS